MNDLCQVCRKSSAPFSPPLIFEVVHAILHFSPTAKGVGLLCSCESRQREGTSEMDSRERKLLTAARLNDVERVKQLLEAGVDPDIEGPFGPVIFMALLLGHTVVARLLVEAGADLHVTDDKGWTPLHWAAKTGEVELVLAMIEADADPFAVDKIGDSPFDVLKKNEHLRALDMIRRKYPREYMKWLEGQEGRL